MARRIKLNKDSIKQINQWLENLNKDPEYNEIDMKQFGETFISIVLKDFKAIKDCPESSIVSFYIESGNELLNDISDYIDDIEDEDSEFWANLKVKTRTKLVNKYVPEQNFDNNIDIYFNEVKREYILHPMNESQDMDVLPENRDIFIKNNLKLVIDCAKRYRNLGLPFEDLIQIGNVGLLTAYDKFDNSRANLRYAIEDDIKAFDNDDFTYEEAKKIVSQNFTYGKKLDSTIEKLPEDGFESKKEFLKWTKQNIKQATFSSIAYIWTRAMILLELNNFSNIIRIPKSAQTPDKKSVTVIRLDSINPYTEDNYSDGQMAEIANEEFITEDENIENTERQNVFKELLNKALLSLDGLDRRIIKRKYGIGFPFPLSINEIAEMEGTTPNKVKYSLSNSMKVIAESINDEDKEVLLELLNI